MVCLKNKKIHKLSLTAIFTALVFVATYFIAIPMPAGIGYVNLGDAFVLLSSWVLGPIGAICAGVGSALADIMLGYAATYAPATLIIKSGMSIACYFIYKIIINATKRPIGFIVSAICAELIMVFGYFLFEGILYGFPTAAANIFFNLVQGLASIIVANVVSNILFANKTVVKYINDIS